MTVVIDRYLLRALIKPDKAAKSERDKQPSSLAFSPMMTPERFAEISGIPIGVLRAQVQRGYIPSSLFGKRRYVNVALLNSILLRQEHKPDTDIPGDE